MFSWSYKACFRNPNGMKSKVFLKPLCLLNDLLIKCYLSKKYPNIIASPPLESFPYWGGHVPPHENFQPFFPTLARSCELPRHPLPNIKCNSHLMTCQTSKLVQPALHEHWLKVPATTF